MFFVGGGSKSKRSNSSPKVKPIGIERGLATARTLYDHESQAEGNLRFATGDVIEIVTRTNNENEWWIGKIKGKEGQFPGMLALFNGYQRL